MRPSGITDGIGRDARCTAKTCFNEAVGYYRRNREARPPRVSRIERLAASMRPSGITDGIADVRDHLSQRRVDAMLQ